MTEIDKILVRNIITKATLDELRELNKQIINEFGFRRQRAVLAFRTGDKVSFMLNRNHLRTNNLVGDKLIGIVTKINQKTVTVHVNGTNWKVSPGGLKKEV